MGSKRSSIVHLSPHQIIQPCHTRRRIFEDDEPICAIGQQKEGVEHDHGRSQIPGLQVADGLCCREGHPSAKVYELASAQGAAK